MSDSEYKLLLDEVERFADQKEQIRDQTILALEQFACDQDGRVDGDSTGPLEATLCSQAEKKRLSKKMKKIQRGNSKKEFLITFPQDSEQPNWGKIERPPSC